MPQAIGDFIISPRTRSRGRAGSGGDFTNVKSFLFDGVDEWINHNTVLDTDGDTPFSMSIWFKADAIVADQVMLSHNVSPLNGYMFRLAAPGGEVEMILSADWNGGDYLHIRTTSINWDDDTWRNAIVTYDGSRAIAGLKIYLDGGFETSSQIGGTALLVGSTLFPPALFIQGRGGSVAWPFLGNLEEPSWWSKELTPAEITEIYNGGSATNLYKHSAKNSLVSWWRNGDHPLDDATGTTGTIRDCVGSNHGTPMNTEAGDIVADVP